MIQQNSEDPTGVSSDDANAHNTLDRARARKANAALALALAGATWVEIAESVGYPTPRQARVAVERALEKRLDEEDKAKMRTFAGARLERLIRSVWAKAIDPDNPEQMVAFGHARAVIADHRKLFGLDAPSEIIVHQPTRAELEQWVAKVTSLDTPPVEEDDVFEVEWHDDSDAPPAIESAG